MKNTSNSNFLMAGLLVFSVVLALGSNTFAQQKEVTASTDNVDLQLLIDSQKQLTDALAALAQPANNEIDDLVVSNASNPVGDGTNFPPSYLCTLDYQNWESSDTYSDSEWSTESLYINAQGGSGSFFQDINGDGLTDYFFVQNATVNRRSCVHLNNGRGWDLVQKCYAELDSGSWTFYGDCAATE